MSRLCDLPASKAEPIGEQLENRKTLWSFEMLRSKARSSCLSFKAKRQVELDASEPRKFEDAATISLLHKCVGIMAPLHGPSKPTMLNAVTSAATRRGITILEWWLFPAKFSLRRHASKRVHSCLGRRRQRVKAVAR